MDSQRKNPHRNNKCNKNNQIYWNQDIPGNPDIFPGKWELEFCFDSREFPFPGIPGANPTDLVLRKKYPLKQKFMDIMGHYRSVYVPEDVHCKARPLL